MVEEKGENSELEDGVTDNVGMVHLSFLVFILFVSHACFRIFLRSWCGT